jgi:hypothetical protein
MMRIIRSHPYSGKEVCWGYFLGSMAKQLKVNALVFKKGQYIDFGTVEELDASTKEVSLLGAS